MQTADPTWSPDHFIKGAGSGEGIIYAVRDARIGREAIKEKGRIVGYQEIELDGGVVDKRALYYTGEFASILKVASRDGNTLSETLREIWDTGSLRNATKNSPLVATNAHIGIIGHITVDELRKLLTSTDLANGFANRFLFLCAKRSKLLPEGGKLSQVDFHPLVERLRKAITFGQQSKELVRNTGARAVWKVVYGMLSENRTGLADTLLARAEAIVFRLSMLYALLDCSEDIRLEHLNAALALWQYGEDSAAYIFGTRIGDDTADTILDALAKAGRAGLTREMLTVDVFQRHIKSAELMRALSLLEEQGRITRTQRPPTGGRGRPVTEYHLQRCEVSEESTRRYLIASNDAAKCPDLACEVSRNKCEVSREPGQNLSPEDTPIPHATPTPVVTPVPTFEGLTASPFNIDIARRAATLSIHDRHTCIRLLSAVSL